MGLAGGGLACVRLAVVGLAGGGGGGVTEIATLGFEFRKFRTVTVLVGSTAHAFKFKNLIFYNILPKRWKPYRG